MLGVSAGVHGDLARKANEDAESVAKNESGVLRVDKMCVKLLYSVELFSR